MAVGNIRLEPYPPIPLAFVFNKFKIGITFLGYGNDGMDK
jgi:hypothetical protein